MNLIEFTGHFPDEESCEQYIKKYREKSGIRCKNCEKITRHYWFANGRFFECSSCRRRSSLKSGTVMENSKLPLRIWLLAMLFMSATKKGFSCLELQRQLGLSRYETTFRLMHRIRSAMGQRDELYILSDMIEYDECYMETVQEKQLLGQLKRGKGSQKQTAVAVAAESVPLENLDSGQRTKRCGYFKMRVMDKVDCESVNAFIRANTGGDVVLFTDKNTAYSKIEEVVATHLAVPSGKESVNDTLKWVHKAISNLKRTLLGVYHMITYKYLQNYLNEFVYRLNRRYFGKGLFERLVIAATYPYVQ